MVEKNMTLPKAVLGLFFLGSGRQIQVEVVVGIVFDGFDWWM